MRRFALSPTILLSLALVLSLACTCDEARSPRDGGKLDLGTDAGRAKDGPRDAAPRELGADGSLDFGRDRGLDLRRDQAPPDQPRPDQAQCKDPGVTLSQAVRITPTNLVAGQSATVVYPASAMLGGRSNLTIHYGFNFWALKLAGKTSAEASMTRRADGAFEVQVQIPANARLMDFVFYSEGGGKKTWDNNSKQDWHRSVAVPYIGPYLTFIDNTVKTGIDRDPAHSITVSFKSDRPCRGSVRFGTQANALHRVVQQNQSNRMHRLRLTGLDADTGYFYRVSCVEVDSACPTAEISPLYSFRTAPSAARQFRFFFIADPQDNRHDKDRWREVAAEMQQRPAQQVPFVVIAGDLVGDDLPERWWDFFDKGRALFAGRAVVPAVGNHDTPTYGSHADTSSFEEHFFHDSSSGKQSYYATTYGNTSFLLLNSETAQAWVSKSDWLPGGTQYEWAKAKIGALKSRWTFAVWHIPPYNAGPRHLDQNGSTRPLTAHFGGKVDWVLGGHEHLYQRSKPIRYVSATKSEVAAQYGRGPADGVGYAIAPAAGHDAPSNSIASNDPIMSMVAHPPASSITNGKIDPWVGYVEVAIDDKRFSLAAHALGEAQPKDQLSYTRP